MRNLTDWLTAHRGVEASPALPLSSRKAKLPEPGPLSGAPGSFAFKTSMADAEIAANDYAEGGDDFICDRRANRTIFSA
jgi:hypothetical protein